MYTSAVVVAAGEGKRLKSKVPKQLIKIDSKPVLIYSLEVLNSHPAIKEIILVVNAGNKNAITKEARRYRIKKVSKIVLGGRRRQDSVFNGLKATSPNADLVLIHDGVRPFIKKEFILALINAACKSGAAVIGVPVKATIKEAGSPFVVKKTLEREKLWEIQTPQVFKKDLIMKAYNKFGRQAVTDDAVLAERFGAKVRLVLGSYHNIKITTREDLAIAKGILKYS